MTFEKINARVFYFQNFSYPERFNFKIIVVVVMVLDYLFVK